jgi:hypothetical protein
MLIFRIDYESIESKKKFSSSNFDMKELGVLDVILGIRIIRNNGGVILTQSNYIEKKKLKGLINFIVNL